MAPLIDQRGAALSHWETLSEVEEDDLIIHYQGGYIRAIGRALGRTYASNQPSSSSEVSEKSAGRRVDVEYFDLTPPITRQQFGERLRDLPIHQGPFDGHGNIKQGYLWRFTPEGLSILREFSSAAWPSWAEETAHSPGKRSWIFQANPKLYDLEKALTVLKEIRWVTRQHASEIHSGDTVFLWLAGNNAGIVAVATVISEPAVLADLAEERQFYRSNQDFAAPERKVRVHIDRVFQTRIARGSVLTDEVLKELHILKAPQGTNFPLTLE